MRNLFVLIGLLGVAACGDTPSDRSAQISRENAAARDAAQAGRIDNPAALACVRANASDQEWAVIAAEGPDAPGVLATVLNRDSTARCFSVNNAVVYI